MTFILDIYIYILWEVEKPRTRRCKPRIRINGKRSRQKGHTLKVLSRNPRSKHDNAITKPEKINMLEEPEDTDTFLEGPRSSHEDHQTVTEGRKEGLSLSG